MLDKEQLKTNLENIIPGVVTAYESLLKPDDTGIFTSNGSFYNHTLFGRDSAMAAKFLLDYDHSLARGVILNLAALQGDHDNRTTQEEVGRIHHELRDFKQWRGSLSERLVLRAMAAVWGVRKGKILTYYAVDTTAAYVRLVNKYATHIDRSILAQHVTTRSGETITIETSLVRAADWLVAQERLTGRFMSYRSNRWALPYQTLQDSTTSYARTDETLANYKQGIAYVEAHAFAIDAIKDVAELLTGHPNVHRWRAVVRRMEDVLLGEFWDEARSYFVSAIDAQGPLDMRNISAGWTLNISMWHDLSEQQRIDKIVPVVKRLFSDEFLTRVGLRTRSIAQHQPLAGVVEYHGSNSVWPMFSFMVIEGLRRHNLYRLAEQLANRVINGLNASGKFDEYFIVSKKGEIGRMADAQHPADVDATLQMIPEQNIAFSIAPAMMMAHRIAQQESPPPQTDWQRQLEEEILAEIPHVDRAAPDKAHEVIGPVHYIRPKRLRGNLRTTWYFIKQSRKMR